MKDKVLNKIWESLILFGVLFGLDRVSKYFIVKAARLIDVTPFLSFDLTFNRGIAWGVFHTQSKAGFLIVTAFVAAIIGAMLWYAWKQLRKGKFAIEEMLILAGAISNLCDRIVYSGVIDFIHVHFGSWSFPIFNLADVFIVLGVFWVLISNYND